MLTAHGPFSHVSKLQHEGDFTGKGIADCLFIGKENLKGSINHVAISIPARLFTGEVAYDCLIPNHIPIEFSNQVQRHRCYRETIEYFQLTLLRSFFRFLKNPFFQGAFFCNEPVL